MIAETALYARLSGFAPLSDLVGGRVAPLVLPREATQPDGSLLASLTYQRISSARTHSTAGVPILSRPRFQLTAWAESYGAAKAVAEQVRAALDGYQDRGAQPWSAVEDNDLDDYDAETGWYRVIVDVLLTHGEQ